MRFATVGLGLGLALFMAPGLGLGQDLDKAADKSPNSPTTYELLNLFGDVFERVRGDYVEKTTDRQLIEAAISGMLTSLDPHSSYLNEKNFREMRVDTKGEFGGLGVEITMDRGLIKVVSPIDDTPAHRAGLKPGDLISHLDGKAVLGLTLQQAMEKMRGPVGESIGLTIQRNGRKPFDVSITRAVIKIQSVRSRVEGDGDVGYIRITRFSERTEAELKKAFGKFKKEAKKPLKGYVLDLRNNPGGLLDQAVKVSDAFLDKGEIVSTRSRREEETQRFNAREGDLAEGLPIVALINGGSASASEIVAGALQDHRRAVVMGDKSFGKGSVQVVIPLAEHGAMRLTTARYYTPSGRSIQAKGIEPDIAVSQAKLEEINASGGRREADLRGALDNGRSGGGETVKSKDAEKAEESAPLALRDYQLARAVDLIRGASLFRRGARN